MAPMNATASARQPAIAPTCSVLAILLPVAGRWIGCQGINCAALRSDPRALVQFMFCIGATVFLGIVLAVIGSFRKEPLGARVFAALFQCAALGWIVAMVLRG